MIIIKPLAKKNIRQIKPLIEKLRIYEESHYGTKFNFELINKSGLEAYYRHHVKNEFGKKHGFIFVAYDGSKQIGYTSGWIEKQPRGVVVVDKVGYLSDLYVDDKYRNKGLGKKLLQTAKSWFKKQGLKFMDIVCYATNPSQKLYRRVGFSDYWIGLRMRLK